MGPVGPRFGDVFVLAVQEERVDAECFAVEADDGIGCRHGGSQAADLDPVLEPLVNMFDKSRGVNVATSTRREHTPGL